MRGRRAACEAGPGPSPAASPSVAKPPLESQPFAGAWEVGSQPNTVSTSIRDPDLLLDAMVAPSEKTASSRCGDTTTTTRPSSVSGTLDRPDRHHQLKRR